MEYCDKGSLDILIEREQLSLARKYRIVLDVANGMAYLHSKRILHRDLKSANVLVDKHYTAKVADFDKAKLASKNQDLHTERIGTAYYCSPEVAMGLKYDLKCDVFSFAMVLHEVMHNKMHPFGTSDYGLTWKIAQNESFRPQIAETIAPWMNNLMHSCWKHDPEQRPSFEEVVQIIEENISE